MISGGAFLSIVILRLIKSKGIPYLCFNLNFYLISFFLYSALASSSSSANDIYVIRFGALDYQ